MNTAEKGFDNEKYITEQTAAILKRVERFNNKLYLEFGGKLLYDYHAARVLPGGNEVFNFAPVRFYGNAMADVAVTAIARADIAEN